MTTSHPAIRDARRQAFLASLAVLGNVTAAAEAAGVDRVTAYRWRENDEDFSAAWDDAIEQAADLIELEARRRAVDGVDEPVFYQGVQCGMVRKYSDTLMVRLLMAHKPDKYRDNSKVELAGRLALNDMSEDEIRAELAALVAAGVLPAPDDGSDLV